MNAKVVLVRGDIEKTVEINDSRILTETRYQTMYDAECIYGSTKTSLMKKGWRRKPASVISKIENAPREKKIKRFLGRIVRGDGTVGGE